MLINTGCKFSIAKKITNIIPTNTIKDGAKYEFFYQMDRKQLFVGMSQILLQQVYPSCALGSRYTTQIKIGNKQLKTTGEWTRNQSLNEVHIQ